MLCITNNLIKHQSFVYTQLNNLTTLFLRIQLSISHLFALYLNVKQFYLNHRWDPIRCNHSRPVNLGVMAMKGYSAFPKAPALLELHHQIVRISYPGHSLGDSYPSAEIKSVYSTAPESMNWQVANHIEVWSLWYNKAGTWWWWWWW